MKIGTNLPAAECFQPDKAFFCGGAAVEGGTSDEGEGAGMREDEASGLELAEEADADADPGSQAEENEIG
jgi:hypothetical protein